MIKMQHCLLIATVLIAGATVAATPKALQSCVLPDKGACVPVSGTLAFTTKISPIKTNTDDVFGLSTALTDTWLVVGAPYDGEKAYRSGAVYIFQQKNGQWLQTAKIFPNKPQASGLFGSSLSARGNTLLIGAPGETLDNKASAGLAYVFKFKQNTWQETAQLQSPTVAAGDFFATSVALTDNQAIIGAHMEDRQGVDSGAVHIYTMQPQGKWQYAQSLKPKTIKSGTLFGNAVAVDGSTLAVGAYGYEDKTPAGGAVYMFTNNKGTWQEQALIEPKHPKAFAEFGFSVALHNKILVVGAPYDEEDEKIGAAFVFKQGNTWQQQTEIRQASTNNHERFGASVALNNTTLVVGAPYGVAYTFQQDTKQQWQRAGMLVGSMPYSDNLFSRTVATNGKVIAIGTPSQQGVDTVSGAVYMFNNTSVQP